ncbi:hypothetical protein OF83DRAFT_18420 [Amylostereum chailletii]|nr:hypothetical protein OF83DRAFT_18420 [Amylostereum chailletii]
MPENVDWKSIMAVVSDDPGTYFVHDPDAGYNPSTIPTKSISQPPSPTEEYFGSSGFDLQVSISTTFHPGATLDTFGSDLTLSSSDSTFFFVHIHRLLACSSNGFNSLLPNTSMTASHPILSIPMDSPALNVLLHSVYGMSAESFRPPLASVFAAIDAFTVYGYLPEFYLAPSQPLFKLFVSYAPASPLACYTKAASLGLDDLAIAVSPYLLSLSLPQLTDDDAVMMGAVYLKRLLFFHLGRVEALKRLLLAPPVSHPARENCNMFDQSRLGRAWMLAVSYLTWEPKPGLSVSAIEFVLKPLADRVTCAECKSLLHSRIKKVLVEWSLVKHTI